MSFVEVRCPFDHEQYPAGHLARYHREQGWLSCSICDCLLESREVEDLVGERLAEFVGRWPRLGAVDLAAVREVRDVAFRAAAGRLRKSEAAALVEAWAAAAHPELAPGLARFVIRKGLEA